MSDDKERNFDITGIDLGGEIREDIIVLVQAEGDPVRDGAKDQDPIAWNRCLDEVLNEIDKQSGYLMRNWKTRSAEVLMNLKEDLEKLRR